MDAIRADGGAAQAVTIDVTAAASIEDGLAQAETRSGPVTVLVNNAGVALTRKALDLDEADWDRVVDTNLKGAWLMAQEAARQMVAQKRGGSIVNIASILGLRVAGAVAPYAAAKAGLLQLTKALAVEFARYGIRVNAIAPGYVATESTATSSPPSPGTGADQAHSAAAPRLARRPGRAAAAAGFRRRRAI